MSFLDALDGNNQSAYDKYEQEMQQLAHSYDPYVSGGKDAFGSLLEQFHQMMNDPAHEINSLASSFQTSPYQNSILDHVKTMMNNSAANTGVMNSGGAQAALQSALSDDVGKFQDNYVHDGLGQYDTGLNLGENLTNTGFNALGNQNQYFQEGDQSGLMGDLSHNQAMSNLLGDGMGAISSISGMGGIPGLLSKLKGFV